MNTPKDNITGKILSDKINQLLSDRKLNVSVEQFQELCNQPSVQPFLKWFCQNVGPDNILSKKEMEMRKNLKKRNLWLTGDHLDTSLAIATADHQELLFKVQANVNYELELSKACKAEEEAYSEDLKYKASLDNSLKRLKELELNQENVSLREEQTKLEKLEITNLKVYNDCLLITNEYDTSLKELSFSLQQAMNAHSEIIKKKARVICWNQVPLDMYVKQIDTYKNYLEFFIQQNSLLFKKHFPDNFLPVKNEIESSKEEDIDSFMEAELKLSGARLVNALSKKIDNEVLRRTGEAAITRAIEIYNNGNINFPKTNSQLMSETADLTARRDILMQKNVILEQELKDCIETYSKLFVSKVLVDIHEFRLQQKKRQLKQLQDILHIARDMGHAHSDLLSMLMQSQLRKLTNFRKIIPEIKRYLKTAYEQSSKRHEYLQNLQAQYNKIDKSSPSEKNIYNKMFVQLLSEDKKSKDSFESSIKQYNRIIDENISLKQELFENNYNNQLQYLQALEKQVVIMYDYELNSGQTKSFKSMPNELAIEFENITDCIERNQKNFTQMRKKFKQLSEKITHNYSDHEKETLWQKFLADPEGLKCQYDKLENELNRTHFGTAFLTEQ